MLYVEQACSADGANLREILESGGEQTVSCWIPNLSWETWLGRSSGILKAGTLETFPAISCVTNFYTKSLPFSVHTAFKIQHSSENFSSAQK